MGLDTEKLYTELRGLFGTEIFENLLGGPSISIIIRLAAERCFTLNITKNVETIRKACYNLHVYGNIHGIQEDKEENIC